MLSFLSKICCSFSLIESLTRSIWNCFVEENFFFIGKSQFSLFFLSSCKQIWVLRRLRLCECERGEKRRKSEKKLFLFSRKTHSHHFQFPLTLFVTVCSTFCHVILMLRNHFKKWKKTFLLHGIFFFFQL